MRRLHVPWLAILTLAVLPLSACGESNQYVPTPPKVMVAKPTQQPVTGYLEATGNTASVNSVDH
jgi:multidrug efflux pump subunit AcrA (membrane-fusion protein)